MSISRRGFLTVAAGAVAAPFVPPLPAVTAASEACKFLWVVGEPGAESFFLIAAESELRALNSWMRMCRINPFNLPAGLTRYVRAAGVIEPWRTENEDS